jgi:hypothetical protein
MEDPVSLKLLGSLLVAGLIVASCGGSDDKKGGLLSGLNQDAKSGQASGTNNAGGTTSGVPDPKAIATTVSQLTGGSGSSLPNVPGLTQDPKVLATTIAQLSGTNLTGNQDPKALATVIAQVTGATGGLTGLPTGNTSAVPDPCALLTLDDAMTVLKSKDVKKDGDASPATAMGARDCDYAGTGNNISSISLTVIATAGMAPQMRSTGYTARKQYEELKRLTKNPVMVPGIGDEAWIDGLFIHVLKKDITFDLLVFTGGDPTEALKAAATRVAAKLP